MKLIRFCLLPLIVLAFVLHGFEGARGETDPQNAVGYYEGTAKSKQAGDLQVSLNLRVVNGEYEGTLATSMGNFALTGASLEGGRLKAQFAADGNRGSFDARLEHDALNGTFKFGDDTGSLSLRRLGDAKAPTPSTPDLKLSEGQWREDLHFLA